MIPTGLIRDASPANGRAALDIEHIDNLAHAIRETGLLHPITVRHGDGPTFDLIAGRNRLEAIRRLGHPTIAARVVEANDTQAAAIRLVENVARSNLTPVEEAQQLALVIETDPEGTIGVARRLGRSEAWVQSRLEIMRYDANLIEAIHLGKVSLAAAHSLARIEPPELQNEYIYQAVTHGINARTAAAWLAQSQGAPAPDFSMAENEGRKANAGITTTTTAKCFHCKDDIAIENAVPIRLCVTCHDAIRQAQHDEERSTPTHDST